MPTRNECPKKGWIWLITDSNRVCVMPTTCKTWACGVCQGKLISLFKMRVEAGCSALQRCAFTTFTLRRDDNVLTAQFVREAWKEFSRRWKKVGEPFEWLKVVELTKKKQPHLHLVMGPVTGKLRCYGPGKKIGEWFQKDRECSCLSHRLSRVWESVTGGSWVVFLVEVTSPSGAGSYLGKYMAKGHRQRQDLWEAGFTRRWSTSRGWPGGGRLRLRQTVERGWKAIELHGMQREKDNPPDLEERVGPEWALEYVAKRDERMLAKRAERYLSNAKDAGEKVVTEVDRRND